MAKKRKNRLYKPFAANLRALWRQFKRCSEMYLPLYHDRLVAWSSEGVVPIGNDVWAAFCEANPEPIDDDGEWWVWDIQSTGDGIGRFWGSPDGLVEFQQLAESASIVIREMEIDTGGIGKTTWLEVLHDVAFRQPLPLLRGGLTVWGYDEHPDEDFDRLIEEWHVSAHGTKEYPLHPYQWTLAHSVFTSSMTLIETILDPDTVLLTPSALDQDHIATLLQPVTRFEEVGESLNENSEKNNVATLTVAGNVFKRTETGTWHLRYVEEEVVEDGNFRHQEGFVICQQLLSSNGLVIENRELGDQSKGKIEKGDSVMQEQDLLSSISAGDEGLADAKSWNETESRQKMTTPEIIAWARTKKNDLKEQLQDARIAKDTAKIKEIEDEQKQLRKITSQMINNRGDSKDFATGNRAERDRSRVSKALSKCRTTLEIPMPRLHRFLKTNLKSNGGTGMRYLRADEVSWEI